MWHAGWLLWCSFCLLGCSGGCHVVLGGFHGVAMMLYVVFYVVLSGSKVHFERLPGCCVWLLWGSGRF